VRQRPGWDGEDRLFFQVRIKQLKDSVGQGQHYGWTGTCLGGRPGTEIGNRGKSYRNRSVLGRPHLFPVAKPGSLPVATNPESTAPPAVAESPAKMLQRRRVATELMGSAR